jgi:predicted transcriptional regulator YheO
MAGHYHKAICDAITLLLDPLAEVVVHDLTTNTIAYIAGTFSNRSIGDPSLISVNDLETDLEKQVYESLNHQGNLIRSISVRLEDDFLLCINYDISSFQLCNSVLESFLKKKITKQPPSLFKDDFKSRLNKVIFEEIQKREWSKKTLNLRQKKELLYYLFQQWAFEHKHSADYAAEILEISRATIFNYLKKWKSDES